MKLEPKELRKFIADSEIEAISKIEILSLTDTELVLMVDSVINQSVNALVNTANALNSLFGNQNKQGFAMQSLDSNNPIPRFMGEFHFRVWQYIAKTNNFENFRALDNYIYSGGTLPDYDVAIIAYLYEKHCIDNVIAAAPDFIRYLQSLKSECVK